jgi:hypothetical protein
MLPIGEPEKQVMRKYTRTDVRARYDRYDRLAEKRIALDKWSTALADIIGSDPAHWTALQGRQNGSTLRPLGTNPSRGGPYARQHAR